MMKGKEEGDWEIEGWNVKRERESYERKGKGKGKERNGINKRNVKRKGNQ